MPPRNKLETPPEDGGASSLTPNRRGGVVVVVEEENDTIRVMVNENWNAGKEPNLEFGT